MKLETIINKISEWEKVSQQIKKELKEMILKLPDNPNIKRLGDKPRCFVINSKNLSNNWSVFYHDFKLQYEKICEIIDNRTPETIVSILSGIIKTGKFRETTGTLYFHKTVIKHLKEIFK